MRSIGKIIYKIVCRDGKYHCVRRRRLGKNGSWWVVEDLDEQGNIVIKKMLGGRIETSNEYASLRMRESKKEAWVEFIKTAFFRFHRYDKNACNAVSERDWDTHDKNREKAIKYKRQAYQALNDMWEDTK